ncbi:hypothetical protein EIN_412330 [Entamoeba invadens IP1]|uniref:CN hydrolase domain-containing protein n=1 Tax=Entamoeba invadens IP1 TaxID=370355 RepID=A0A0A1UFD9_ENTIV|nr:hypothetical protein EIN_412330 [Entamoeba invadens IP1]ELP95364.1 hypothetical protein EIN_412330 [Entamoeba invadens IP1]|eukprot:XP_004262135.1 hypothetical protein EIN_412330 [Entamoeba invadens IP1]
MRIALIQTDVFPTLEETFSQISKLVEETPSGLYLLTEVFSTGFCFSLPDIAHKNSGDDVVDRLQVICVEKNCCFIGGILVEENGKYYNRVVIVDKRGLIATYDKYHLYRLGCEDSLVNGSKRVIFKYQGIRMLIVICYDLRFPAFIRYSETNDYDIIINPINYGEKVFQIADHFAAARALENSAWIFCTNRIGKDGLGITYKGKSFVYNHLGIKVAEAGEKCEAISVNFHKKEVEEYRRKIGFGENFDKFNFEKEFETVVVE